MRSVGRCFVIELLLTVGLVVCGLFVVGAVIFHILVGLVLLPIKLVFVVFFALFAIPLALMGASLVLGALSIALALGTVALICMALF
jgi:hypothetical protein